MENANKILFRCSGLGYIMKDPKSKADLIADTVKTHLIDVFLTAKHGRREEIKSKYLHKGNACEEDSITLFSRVSKINFKKNSIRLSSEFMTGELDLFLGEAVEKSKETFDTKTSWSAHTFYRAKFNPLDPNYYWQGQGYMHLSGSKKHTVAYCLVNGTAEAILNEKRIASYSSTSIDFETDPEYIARCKQIEINHIFDIELFKSHNPGFDFHNDIDEWKWDIPFKERVHTFTFDRDEDAIKRLIARIRLCRNWMNRELFNV